MSQVRVVEADDRRLERWDDEIERSVNGTLFHLRRFLAYHRDRFRGSERFLVVLDGDNVIAQLPAAIEEDASGRHLRSPYGASYGGPAFLRYPTYSQSIHVVEALIAWIEAEGVTRVTITPPIPICSPLPLDTFHFALLASGFKIVNRDVSSVMYLDPDSPIHSVVTSRARNMARKAERAGVSVQSHGDLEAFWSVMEATFERHGTQPTHTFEEFRWLAEALPGRVYADLAYHDGQPVAGVGYFVINPLVNSSFYFCQRPDRRELNGLTLSLLHGLERAQREGFRWFDFGTSTAGMQPRENVFRFKEQFSRVGQFRETFLWEADGARA